jgi:DNA-binding MarR family transcriptional regulator
MDDTEADAREFAELFPAVYLRFHRRVPKRSKLTAQSSAILQHLALTGPLTVTEAARHMNRAQSVMSEIVTGLEKKGLLARMADSRDRRRTLVWLTEDGQRALSEDRQVLSVPLLRDAMARVPPDVRQSLLRGLGALVRAVDHRESEHRHNGHRRNGQRENRHRENPKEKP